MRVFPHWFLAFPHLARGASSCFGSDWLIALRGLGRLDVTGHFLDTLCLYFKTVLELNLSHENEFDLHENEPVGGTHFHMNGFSRRLILTQRQKKT